MLLRKSLLLTIFLTLIFTLIPLNTTSAQDGEIVTAEVVVDTLNVRYAPNAYWEETLVGQIHRGDVVTVQYYQSRTWRHNNSTTINWVYITQPNSGLEGWVYKDYLYFSRADWQNVLPSVDTIRELSYQIAHENQPLHATIWVSGGSPVAVRAEPYYGAEVMANLPSGSDIEIYGSARINGFIYYVYAKSLDSDIEGWMSTYYIYPVIWDVYDGWETGLPILVEQDYSVEYANMPIAVIAKSTYYYEFNRLNIRSAPSINSPIIATLPSGMRLAVHGRTNHETEGWVYVTVIDGVGYSLNASVGLSGWVFDPNWDAPYLRYENGVTRDSLPIVNAGYGE